MTVCYLDTKLLILSTLNSNHFAQIMTSFARNMSVSKAEANFPRKSHYCRKNTFYCNSTDQSSKSNKFVSPEKHTQLIKDKTLISDSPKPVLQENSCNILSTQTSFMASRTDRHIYSTVGLGSTNTTTSTKYISKLRRIIMPHYRRR